jgi:hypothetical protein
MKRAHRKQKQVRTVSARSSAELSRTLVRWTVVRVLDGRVVRHSGDRLEVAEIAPKVQVQKLIKQKVRIVRTGSDYPARRASPRPDHLIGPTNPLLSTRCSRAFYDCYTT